MKLKNLYVYVLNNIIYELDLQNKESRMRTRLWKKLAQKIEELNQEKEDLIGQYKITDNDGNPIFEKEDDKYPKVSDEFYKEYDALLNEEYIINMDEENRDMLITVARMFLREKITVSKDLAVVYDALCEEFEKVLEHYNQGNKNKKRNRR